MLEALADTEIPTVAPGGGSRPSSARLEGGAAGANDEVGAFRELAAFRRGDERAFEVLYRRHTAMVYGLAYRLSTRRAEAEDLTQEVFLAAWENRSTFQSPVHLLHWLRRVAVNRWLNRMRRRREVEWDAEEGEGREPEAPATSAPTVRIDLERALALLSPRLRAVVLLFDLYGMAHDEIGEVLDMTTGAAKVQLHRARRRLREILR